MSTQIRVDMYQNEHVLRRFSESFKLKILAELSIGKYSKRELSRLYGVANGKSTLNFAKPSLTKEATVKIAKVGVSIKTEVKETGKTIAQKTETLSASAYIVAFENTKTTNYVESKNGNCTEVSKKEDNTVKVTDTRFIRVAVSGFIRSIFRLE